MRRNGKKFAHILGNPEGLLSLSLGRKSELEPALERSKASASGMDHAGSFL
jgi:hypothetical protein